MQPESGNEGSLPARGPTPFPITVKIGAIIWIVVGCLGVMGMILSLATAEKPPQGGYGGGAYAAGRQAGGWCGGLLAAAFIYAGVQTSRGKAPDTLGNARGSILLGAVYVALAGLILVVGKSAEDAINAVVLIIIGGVPLVAAGVLALMGRQEYKAWRAAHTAARPTS
jgi:hypothetical protein